MSDGQCWNGDRRLAVYQDTVTLRGFCTICASNVVVSSHNVHTQYLSDLVPYQPGERVECWTVGTDYDGFGTVVELSTDLRNGGTPVHPAYLVKLDHQEDPLWYTPICLKRVKGESIV